MDGLALLARDVVQQDPFSGAAFVFTNRGRTKLKILVWDRNGFVVWYKRLERDRFAWPRAGEEVLTLSHQQLGWLLDGYDVWRMKPHASLQLAVCG